MNAAMTLEEFRAYLAAALDLDADALPVGANLRTEAGLDSIQLFLLLIAVEDLGIEIPEGLLGQLETVRDAHHHYLTVFRHRT